MWAHIKNAWKSWTIWFNGATAAIIAGLPAVEAAFPQVKPYIPADLYQYAMGALVIGNVLLRFKTTSSLAAK